MAFIFVVHPPTVWGALCAGCMKITERIVIKALPERVWGWLVDPALWGRWNPKVKRVKRDRTGAMVAGEVFEADFALNDKGTSGRWR